MKKNTGFRQGDVLVIPVATIPASAQEVQPRNGRLIVAEGEATGHHHSFPHRQGAVMFRDDVAGGGDGEYPFDPRDLLGDGDYQRQCVSVRGRSRLRGTGCT